MSTSSIDKFTDCHQRSLTKRMTAIMAAREWPTYNTVVKTVTDEFTGVYMIPESVYGIANIQILLPDDIIFDRSSSADTTFAKTMSAYWLSANGNPIDLYIDGSCWTTSGKRFVINNLLTVAQYEYSVVSNFHRARIVYDLVSFGLDDLDEIIRYKTYGYSSIRFIDSVPLLMNAPTYKIVIVSDSNIVQLKLFDHIFDFEPRCDILGDVTWTLKFPLPIYPAKGLMIIHDQPLKACKSYYIRDIIMNRECVISNCALRW